MPRSRPTGRKKPVRIQTYSTNSNQSALDEPLRPYRTEISACIRIQPRPRFLLCLQLRSAGVYARFLISSGFIRDVPLAVEAWDTSFRTLLCGLETMLSAWPISSLSVLVAAPKALLLCPSLVSRSVEHAARLHCHSKPS
jgi:hypothetical protein